MSLIFVAGYRGSGKDTLYRQLLDRDYWLPFNWIIYTSEDNLNNKENPFLQLNGIKRVSFADALKKEVKEKLIKENLIDNQFDVESHKDIPLVMPGTDLIKKRNSGSPRSNNTISNKTFRDYCIQRAEEARDKNPNHWCAKVLSDVYESENVLITDWRYPNELEYYTESQNIINKKIITCRVYRSQVPIPDKEIASEHSLDEFKTDYLLVTSEEEFTQAIKVFPLYTNYRCMDKKLKK